MLFLRQRSRIRRVCCISIPSFICTAGFLLLLLPPTPTFNYSSTAYMTQLLLGGRPMQGGGAHLSRSNSTSSTRKSRVSTSLWICCRSSSSFCRSSADLSLSAAHDSGGHEYMRAESRTRRRTEKNVPLKMTLEPQVRLGNQPVSCRSQSFLNIHY